MSALPRPKPRKVSTVAPVRGVPVAQDLPETAPGPPPRAGFVNADGEIVLWSDGNQRVLGTVPGRRDRAFETAAGVYVVTSAEHGVLVRWDGAVERLNLGGHPARSADGRFLAGVEMHSGRRAWNQVHLIDLSTGERWSLPREDGLNRHVTGIHDGTVHFGSNGPIGRVSTSYRWTPGQEPQQREQRQREPGIPFTFEAPGGVLGRFRYCPPTAILFDPATGTTTERTLPAECDTSVPIWEDADTVLFRTTQEFSRRIIRWRRRDDTFEHYDLPGDIGYRALLVEALLTPSSPRQATQ